MQSLELPSELGEEGRELFLNAFLAELAPPPWRSNGVKFGWYEALDAVEELQKDGAMKEGAFVTVCKMLADAKKITEQEAQERAPDNVVLYAATNGRFMSCISEDQLSGSVRLHIVSNILRARREMEEHDVHHPWLKPSDKEEWDVSFRDRFFGGGFEDPHDGKEVFTRIAILSNVGITRPHLFDECANALRAVLPNSAGRRLVRCSAALVTALLEQQVGEEASGMISKVRELFCRPSTEEAGRVLRKRVRDVSE